MTIKFDDNASWGDLLGPAMEITEQTEADIYFEKLIEFGLRKNGALSRGEVEKNYRSSLGYYAGYYNHETRVQVERLFKCNHPVFGEAKEGPPASQEAFNKGVARARSGTD